MRMRSHVVWLVWMLLFLGGCQVVLKEIADGQQVEFSIVDEKKIPKEMAECIEKMAEESFQITYVEGGWTYIGQGYGRQETKGYAIRIDKCMEGKDVIGVQTTLLGPGSDEIKKDGEELANVCMREGELSKYPYAVWKIAKNEKPVIFK